MVYALHSTKINLFEMLIRYTVCVQPEKCFHSASFLSKINSFVIKTLEWGTQHANFRFSYHFVTLFETFRILLLKVH